MYPITLNLYGSWLAQRTPDKSRGQSSIAYSLHNLWKNNIESKRNFQICKKKIGRPKKYYWNCY